MYHYAACGSCNNALKFVKKNNLNVLLVDIVTTPPSRSELERMLKAKKGELKKLFNTSGERYRELDLKSKFPSISVDDALTLLARERKLIKRPFLLSEKVGLVGFREEEWKAKLL